MPLPDWLTGSLSGPAGTPPSLLLWRIGVALALGVVVAGLYRWARRGEAVQATFVTTLILLAALIAMATQVIGDNVARAFSLVGALSVVRFRTVVKDTQDTAFVIFAVIAGMAAGSNHLAVALVGIAVIGAAAPLLWPRAGAGGWARADGELSMRVDLGDGVRASAEAVIAAASDRFELTAAGTARQGSALDLTYHVRLRPGTSPTGLVVDLNGLAGVENVELKRGD